MPAALQLWDTLYAQTLDFVRIAWILLLAAETHLTDMPATGDFQESQLYGSGVELAGRLGDVRNHQQWMATKLKVDEVTQKV